MLSIYTNLGALRPLRRLGEATSALSQSSERLATGIRINRASDDAAGLSIAASLNAKGRIDAQAIRNVNDGISYLNVADGATGELKNILIRLRELSTQSANGSFSNSQRQSLDKEAQALQKEYNRIIETTTFNGLAVFGGTVDVQAGDGGEGIVVGANVPGRLVGDGTFQDAVSFATGLGPGTVTAADLNGDGVLDLVTRDYNDNTTSVLLGNGDGTFQARVSFATGLQPTSVAVADLNGDGAMDLVTTEYGSNTASILLGNGDGTFQAKTGLTTGSKPMSVAVADLDGDGVVDVITADGEEHEVSIFLGNGDGTFRARVGGATAAGPISVTTVDLNGDGVLDLVTANIFDRTTNILLGNGDGTFQAHVGYSTTLSLPRSVTAADLNNDGVLDLILAGNGGGNVLLGNGDGTFHAITSYSISGILLSATAVDLNDDKIVDIIAVGNGGVYMFSGNGDGTFRDGINLTTGTNLNSVAIADFNGDGVIDLVTTDYGSDTVSILLGNSVTKTGLTSLSGINVATQASARSAQGKIDDYFDELNTVSDSIGVGLSRLEVAAANLQTTVEGVKAAESRITDVDIAEEATRLVSTRILQQAASGVLAHAIKGPELALTLLQAE